MYGDNGAQVTLGVLVGIKVTRETLPRKNRYRSDVLNVSWILTLARYPNCVQLFRILSLQVSYVRLKVQRHFVRQ